MDAERAHELLAADSTRIERALSRLGHVDDGEAPTEDPAGNATDLYQDEYDEGLGADLRDQLAAVTRAEERLPGRPPGTTPPRPPGGGSGSGPAPMGSRSRGGSRFRTSGSRPSRRPSSPRTR